MMAPQWFIFEVKRAGLRPEFIGRCETTRDEIARIFGARAFIVGNLVTLYGPPIGKSTS